MPKKRSILGDKSKKSSAWGFSKCTIFEKDRVYVMSHHLESQEKGKYITQVLKWDGTAFSHWLVPWATGAICSSSKPRPNVLTMGLGGRIHVATIGGFGEEEIDTTVEGPPYRGMLRDIRAIGDHVYVTGMGRQVYKRMAPDNWQRIDRQILAPIGKTKGIGLNSIHGFSDNEIYAAGWNGEIWMYDGADWQQIDSPTNLILERVVCAPNGDVYICGQRGILIRGRKNSWSVVDHDTTQENLWGMTWFNGSLWVSTLSELFILNDKDDLEMVDMGEGDRLTCGWLDANEEVLWSVGAEDLAF